jgi:hypothetical protein
MINTRHRIESTDLAVTTGTFGVTLFTGASRPDPGHRATEPFARTGTPIELHDIG